VQSFYFIKITPYTPTIKLLLKLLFQVIYIYKPILSRMAGIPNCTLSNTCTYRLRCLKVCIDKFFWSVNRYSTVMKIIWRFQFTIFPKKYKPALYRDSLLIWKMLCVGNQLVNRRLVPVFNQRIVLKPRQWQQILTLVTRIKLQTWWDTMLLTSLPQLFILSNNVINSRTIICMGHY